MPLITLDSAIKITGLSRRTLWRRMATDVADMAQPARSGRGPRTARIALNLIQGDLLFSLEQIDPAVIEAADSGDPEAQNDVALMLLLAARPDLAVQWLQDAAAQDYPDAMHWLGRCHLAGEGLPHDEGLGLSWLGRAAARGHMMSRELLAAIGVIPTRSGSL